MLLKNKRIILYYFLYLQLQRIIVVFVVKKKKISVRYNIIFPECSFLYLFPQYIWLFALFLFLCYSSSVLSVIVNRICNIHFYQIFTLFFPNGICLINKKSTSFIITYETCSSSLGVETFSYFITVTSFVKCLWATKRTKNNCTYTRTKYTNR